MQQDQEKMSENQMECEFSDYSLGSELDLSRTVSLTNLQVVEIPKVMQIINKTIESVMEKCDQEKVRLDNVIELFQHYHWKKDLVEQNYFLKQDEVLKQLKAQGIWNDHSQIAYQTQVKQTCPVCLEENYLIQLGCLHKFCQSCIEQTIQYKVKEEYQLIIRCLQVGCIYRIPYSMIEKYCNPQDLQNVLCRRFVENQVELANCPGVDCVKILLNHNLKDNNVTCPSCLNQFCFRCKTEDHSPAPCDLVQKWINKTTKDDANIRWIALNTKNCPFCKNAVEKSQGCNFLHCKPPGGCGGSFCYVCGNAWEPDHTDHFKCNKYVAPETNQEKEKEMLARYNFFYGRFLNSEQNYKQNSEAPQFKKIIDNYQITAVDSEFIGKSLEELLLSRRILKWTYCYNFFIRQSNLNQDRTLEYYEEQFEIACEQLAISLVRFFDEVENFPTQKNNNQTPLDIRKTNFQKTKDNTSNQLSKTSSYRQTLEQEMKKGQIC